MGFSLPAALGDTATNPDIPVIDIDGDGSFIMNELVTILVEKLPLKIMMLNNQHLGTVVQWEDCFCKADCVHTYLGDPDDEAEIFHNFARWLKVTRNMRCQSGGASFKEIRAEGNS
ncbi:unnamed protein product [Sphagnum jensenii]|uniref:Thiamine pyrophosphate enzyme TPP-binding domain-containing protein n=1 Tax=Sphagnum jensenii TaxID=128206 RepID=A0ABP0VW14_9BRYO